MQSSLKKPQKCSNVYKTKSKQLNSIRSFKTQIRSTPASQQPSKPITYSSSINFSTKKRQSQSQQTQQVPLKSYDIYNATTLQSILNSQESITAGTVLYISNVIPDNNATAAGVRTFGIFRLLKQLGFQPILMSPSRFHSTHQNLIDSLTKMNIPLVKCEVNDSSNQYEEFIQALSNGTYFQHQYDQSIQNITKTTPNTNEIDTINNEASLNKTTNRSIPQQSIPQSNPPHNLKLTMVIYDRFSVEEMFGVRTMNATTEPFVSVIDTQDLHFLRFLREEWINSNTNQNDSESNSNTITNLSSTNPLFSTSPSIIRTALTATNPHIQRELAPYFRSDFVLTVSQNESDLLQQLGLPPQKTLYLPITYDTIPTNHNSTSKPSDTTHPTQPNDSINHDIDVFSRPFSKRSNTMFIGTMKHPPNVNCVEELRDVYVPLLQSQSTQIWNQITTTLEKQEQYNNHLNTNTNTAPNPINDNIVNQSSYNNQSTTSLNEAHIKLTQLRYELNKLQLQQTPSIHAWGTYMTKDQTNWTILPSTDHIQLEQQISQLEHQINQLSLLLSKYKSNLVNSTETSNTSVLNPSDATPELNMSDQSFTNQINTILSSSPTSSRLDINQPNLFNQKGPLVMKGTAKNAIQTISRYTSLLTPLHFGAGVKGKVLDAWISGTPVIGTSITAEGLGVDFQNEINNNNNNDKLQCCMKLNQTEISQFKCDTLRQQLQQLCIDNGDNYNLLDTQWPGIIHQNPTILSTATLLLNQCECEWNRQHIKIQSILNEFTDENGRTKLVTKLQQFGFQLYLQSNNLQYNNQDTKLSVNFQSNDILQSIRNQDWIGQMLYHRNNNSQYYMPKYINTKNQLDQLVKSQSLHKPQL